MTPLQPEHRRRRSAPPVPVVPLQLAPPGQPLADDRRHGFDEAALDVINWWAFPENSNLLFDVLESIGKELAMTDPPWASAHGTEPTPFLPPRPNAPGGLP